AHDQIIPHAYCRNTFAAADTNRNGEVKPSGVDVIAFQKLSVPRQNASQVRIIRPKIDRSLFVGRSDRAYRVAPYVRVPDGDTFFIIAKNIVAVLVLESEGGIDRHLSSVQCELPNDPSVRSID